MASACPHSSACRHPYSRAITISHERAVLILSHPHRELVLSVKNSQPQHRKTVNHRLTVTSVCHETYILLSSMSLNTVKINIMSCPLYDFSTWRGRISDSTTHPHTSYRTVLELSYCVGRGSERGHSDINVPLV